MTTRTTFAPMSPSLGRFFTAPATTLGDLYELHLQRRSLARLDAAARADIGVTEGQVIAEANRAPWKVPTHWRR